MRNFSTNVTHSTEAVESKGIQNSKFRIQNSKLSPSEYPSPTTGEVGRGGRNCARRPRRAGGATEWRGRLF